MRASSIFARFGLALGLVVSAREAHAQGVSLSGQASASSSGAQADGAATGPRPAPASPQKSPAEEWAERDAKLDESLVLSGGVGLLHTQHAQGGAPGQFRLGLATEFFSGSGFLCTREFPCANPTGAGRYVQDVHDHFGARLAIGVQATRWLEVYGGTSALANSNQSGSPQLLQVLGDTNVGAKVHAPLGKVFHLGGALEAWLLSGAGGVGIAGGGTGGKLRGLATADLRGLEKRVPLRLSANATYSLDNSGVLVEDVEAARRSPISRIERFGLGVNRVDHVDVAIGAETFLAKERLRPFVEYVMAIPVNRQGYACRADNPSSDGCLANDALAPSKLALGARVLPWKHGFALTAAVDVGLEGTGRFIEEMAPVMPWTLYLGAGWAFDTRDRPQAAPAPAVAAAPAKARVVGQVHEVGTNAPVVGAVVSWDTLPTETALSTGTNGLFRTRELDAGDYAFSVRAEGYKPGACTAHVASGAPAAPAPAGAGGGGAPSPAPADVVIDCPLEALPKVGTVLGKVRDAESGQPVASVQVKLVDAAKKELSATTDAQGAFRFELVGEGAAQIEASAEAYLVAVEPVTVAARKDTPVELRLQKRAKNGLVSVGAKEIVVKQQIQFALDSAEILPASVPLLTEIADTFVRTPRVKRVEVQGHTDNSGTAERNQRLSDDRAQAVVAWLTAHGVSADRLVAKGYGQNKPLVPNVTAQNRTKNRRVQFVILDQQ